MYESEFNFDVLKKLKDYLNKNLKSYVILEQETD